MSEPRPYSGTTEGVGRGKRPGTEHLAAVLHYLSAGVLWNNGTYGIRPVRDGSALSVHATGRAVDMSARATDHPAGYHRQLLERTANWLADHANRIGIELIIDYSAAGGLGGGRAWKCDRQAWKWLAHGAVSGGGAAWADWLHIELSPAAADDALGIQEALTDAARAAGMAPNDPPTPRYPGRTLQLGSKGVSVKAVQRRIGVVDDGVFGPVTDRHVRTFQKTVGITVDGVVGPVTWRRLFG